MFLNEGLKKVKSIKRKGILGTVNLPAKSYGSYDVLINVKNKELSFTDGDSIFIIDELIGIGEESEFTVFIADKYIVVELQWGRIYLKDSNGKPFYVTETGSLIKKNVDDSHVKWLTQKDLLDYLELIVSGKYNIPQSNKSLIRSYIDNLSITVVSANEKIKHTDKEHLNINLNNYMFRLRVKEYYCDLGLDAFDYKVFEDTKKSVLTNEDKKIEAFNWEEEKRQAMAEKQRERQAELEYKRLKDGEDFIESDFKENIYDDDDEELENEEYYAVNGFSITEME